MAIMGLCHICGKPSSTTCPGCGRPICRDHKDISKGVCTKCASGTMGPGRNTDHLLK